MVVGNVQYQTADVPTGKTNIGLDVKHSHTVIPYGKIERNDTVIISIEICQPSSSARRNEELMRKYHENNR